MKLEYWMALPNRWSFYEKKVIKFIGKYIPRSAKVLVPFAGKFKFGDIDNSIFIYNDINKEIKANHHIDAYRLCWLYPKEYFDCIIADPPYSFYQNVHQYGNKRHHAITKFRETANYLLKPRGIYIELGYNSLGLHFSKASKIALGIWCTMQSRHDVLIVVQRKYNNLERWL